MGRLYRILTRLGLLLAGTVVVFTLLETAPGGRAAANLGVGRPFYVQYFGWLLRVLRGDLGWSPSNSEPVSRALVERLPATIELACSAFIGALVLAALIGFVRARARTQLVRTVLAVTQLAVRAIPFVLLALFLQLSLMFTIRLPVAGIASTDAFDVFDRLRHLVVPVLCLAVPFGAWSSLVFYDFFRVPDGAARMSARSVVGIVAITAASIGPALLSASLILEPRFAWPGVSRLLHYGISQFDFALIAGFLLAYFSAITLLDLCAEFSFGVQFPTLPRQWTGVSAIAIGALVVLLGAALGALAANLAPFGPYFIDQDHWQGYPLPPGVAGHALGTDENGRDLMSRLLFAFRMSLGIAAAAAAIATAIGAVAAKAVKAMPWFDDRAALSLTGIRPVAALPFILAAVTVLVAKFGIHGVLSPPAIALIIAVVSWPAIIPAFRAVTSATIGGVVDLFACALLLEFTLSMSGFGVQPPAPSLGNMLVNAQSTLFIAPWIVIVPTVAIVVTLFALYALADELRDGRSHPPPERVQRSDGP